MGIDLYIHVLALFHMGCTAVFLDEWVNIKRLQLCCKIANCKGFIGTPMARFIGRFIPELRAIPGQDYLTRKTADGKTTVPKHLQGSISDCMAVVIQAFEWGMNPHAVAQKTHVVNGALGYEAQLVNAVVQRSGAIVGRFHYEHRDAQHGFETRVGAVLRGESEITWGEWLNVNAPKVKNSPLWQVNPKQQMGYLQVKNWARAYCPGAILGVYTADELADTLPPEPSSAPAPRGPQRRSAASAPVGTQTPAATSAPAAAPAADPSTGEVPPPAQQESTQQRGDTAERVSAGEVAYLRKKLASASMAEADVLARYGLERLEDMGLDAFDEIKSELLRK